MFSFPMPFKWVENLEAVVNTSMQEWPCEGLSRKKKKFRTGGQR